MVVLFLLFLRLQQVSKQKWVSKVNQYFVSRNRMALPLHHIRCGLTRPQHSQSTHLPQELSDGTLPVTKRITPELFCNTGDPGLSKTCPIFQMLFIIAGEQLTSDMQVRIPETSGQFSLAHINLPVPLPRICLKLISSLVSTSMLNYTLSPIPLSSLMPQLDS